MNIKASVMIFATKTLIPKPDKIFNTTVFKANMNTTNVTYLMYFLGFYPCF